MRYIDLVESETISPVIDEKKLAKASSDGFVTDKLWYHGTRRKFSSFRIPKKSGIDELGRGVYVTSHIGTANVWAQGSGFVLACVIKQGRLVELSKLQNSQLWDSGPDKDPKWGNPVWNEAYEGYDIYMTREFGPGSTPPYREFAERIAADKIDLSTCLSEMGYVGATHEYSQIKGQAVIWNPENIRVVGKSSGLDGYYPG